MAPSLIASLTGLLLIVPISTALTWTPMPNLHTLPSNCVAGNIHIGSEQIHAMNENISALPFALDFNDPANVIRFAKVCLTTALTQWATPFTENITEPLPVTLQNLTLAAIFSKPEKPRKDIKALHVLVHDLTYDRWMWHGLGTDNATRFAYNLLRDGYYTLAIDLWGHSMSRAYGIPDPIHELQGPAHVEILHSMLKDLRRKQDHEDSFSGIGVFDRIAYWGHGFGGHLGLSIVDKYPDDVDAIAISGHGIKRSGHSLGRFHELAPWRERAPFYWRDPNSSPAYLVVDSVKDREETFYYPGDGHDEDFVKWDYRWMDMLALGEVCSPGRVKYPIEHWMKPTLIVMGEHDSFAVNKKELGMLETQVMWSMLRTRTFMFPEMNETAYYWKVEGASHNWMFHKSVQNVSLEEKFGGKWPGF